MQPSNVVALPAFADNDIRLLHDGTQGAVVDPGDAEPVTKAPERAPNPVGILVTRHYGDHVGGVVDALRPRPSCPHQPWKNEFP
jgi:hydroxyacylglutathione hydrolase